MNRSLFLILPALLSGCAAAWEAIEYAPAGLAGKDPRAEIESIVTSKPGCISRVAWGEKELRVEARCGPETEQYVAHFDRVQRIEVKRHNKLSDTYLVALAHNDGSAEFYWQPRNRDEATRLADALSALATPPPPRGALIEAR